MSRRTATTRTALTVLIALVWLVNGLVAKVLGYAPRHTEIVAEVLGAEVAGTLILVIGLGDVALAAWIVGGRFPVSTAWLQVGLVLAMNVLELVFARELLLFGPLNFVFALGFCGLVYVHGVVLGGRLGHNASHGQALDSV